MRSLRPCSDSSKGASAPYNHQCAKSRQSCLTLCDRVPSTQGLQPARLLCPRVKLSAISGGQFPNVALLCRDVIAYTERSHLSPTTSNIVVSSVVHRKTEPPRYSSNSVGCNTLHLASKVVCKGNPLDPFSRIRKYAHRHRFALCASSLNPLLGGIKMSVQPTPYTY